LAEALTQDMSAISPEFDSFLSSVQSSGLLDSTADFTINTLKARQKVSSSQLPREGLWLVKLVQAAVSIGAEHVEIKFGRREVRFSFDVEEWPWEPRQVLADFLSGVLPSEPVLLHLFAGLRNSLFEDTVRAEWSIATTERSFTAKFHSEGTDVSEQAGKRKAGFRLVTSRPPRWPGLKKASTLPIKHLIRRTADEFMAVHSYCWPCPIAISLDGRPLETRYVPSASLDSGGFLQHAVGATHLATYKVRPAILVRRSLKGDEPFHVPWEQDPGEVREAAHSGHSIKLKRRTYFGQTWMEYSLPSGSTVGGCLLLLFGIRMESRIEFICDGAVVDTHNLPWSSKTMTVMGQELPLNQCKVSVRVLVPVRASQLDLSHFQVREKEDMVKIWEPRIRETLRETCEAVLEFAGEFKPDFLNQPKNLLGSAACGYLRLCMSMHPIFFYLTRHGFRKEVNSLLESVTD
jgi:hypothetical protein